MSDQIKLSTRAFYRHGSWYIDIEAPRWLIEAFDEIGVQFSKASTSYLANSGNFSDAGILLRASAAQPVAINKEQSHMEGLTEGRIVHFVLPDGEHRPAMVVKVWDKETGYVNLQVITDGANDVSAYNDSHYSEAVRDEVRRGIRWETSIYPDEDEKKPRTWHWIEKA